MTLLNDNAIDRQMSMSLSIKSDIDTLSKENLSQQLTRAYAFLRTTELRRDAELSAHLYKITKFYV